ncbi:XRE family transcriptional regulator [Clostridium botulinum]|nr:XRE family transcriptional regulator [Clostridium botulinum]
MTSISFSYSALIRPLYSKYFSGFTSLSFFNCLAKIFISVIVEFFFICLNSPFMTLSFLYFNYICQSHICQSSYFFDIFYVMKILQSHFFWYIIFIEGGENLKERLKELRHYLKLSQAEFGEKIFATQTHISSLESGRRQFTERTINDICTSFGVNEEWFRTGKGEMMIDLIDEIENIDDESKDILRKIMKLNANDKATAIKILNTFISD